MSSREERLDDAVFAYCQEVDDGRAPTPAEFLARYPDLAADLENFLAVQERLAPLLGPVRDVALAFRGATAGAGNTGPYRIGAEASGPLPSVPGYEVLGELGRGGMGVVYKARDERLNRVVALKMIRAGDFASREERDRLRSEAEAAARVQHPHVVQVYASGESGGCPYFVCEYVAGGNLRERIRREPQPAADAARLVMLLTRAVHAAHQKGIVHRDLKPANVLLAAPADEPALNTAYGLPKVADFGLAKYLDGPGRGTATHAHMGTPEYMAPEQASGQAKAVGPAADIYALGVILYELLTGRLPFCGEPPLGTRDQVRTRPAPSPRELRPDLSAELEAICLRCLAKAPGERYPTALALAEDLGRFLAGDTADPVRARPPAWWLQSSRARRWRVGLLGAAAGLALFGVLLGLILHGRNTQGRTEPSGNAQGGSTHKVIDDGPTGPVRMTGEHPGACLSMAFMPDGKRAVSESGGGGVYVWDVEKHFREDRQLHGFKQPDKDQESSGVVAVSPDGKYVVTAFALAPTGYMNFLQLYDQNTKLLDEQFAVFLGTMGRALAFSLDGSRLATLDLPGWSALLDLPPPTIRIFGVPSGKEWKKFPCGKGVKTLAYSPDGKSLAFAGSDKSIRLRDLERERLEREFRSHAAAVDQVAFSGDGKRIFSASGGDGTVRVWNNEGAGAVVEKELMNIDVGKKVALMTCAAFWPGGRALTGHADGSVALWDLTTSEELTRFTHEDHRVTAVAISPDGRRALAAFADHLVYLYRLPPLAGP